MSQNKKESRCTQGDMIARAALNDLVMRVLRSMLFSQVMNGCAR